MKIRTRRTDLALESKELAQGSVEKTTQLPGVEAEDHLCQGYPVTTVRVLNPQGAELLGKPMGNYVTLTLDGLHRREENAFPRAVRALAELLTPLLPEERPDAPVLVAGLGNRAITPDAIGPWAQEHTLVTRHLVSSAPEHFGDFRPVTALATGVLGTTGLESGELVKSLCDSLHPAFVIAVDALAARSMERLCRTVQVSDSGISPGSGVGNHRHALNRDTLGVPVLAVGVPTVVEAATLAADLLDLDEPPKLGEGLFVTPKDIDVQAADLSKVIGYGITLALQPGLTMEDLDLLLS